MHDGALQAISPSDINQINSLQCAIWLDFSTDTCRVPSAVVFLSALQNLTLLPGLTLIPELGPRLALPCPLSIKVFGVKNYNEKDCKLSVLLSNPKDFFGDEGGSFPHLSRPMGGTLMDACWYKTRTECLLMQIERIQTQSKTKKLKQYLIHNKEPYKNPKSYTHLFSRGFVVKGIYPLLCHTGQVCHKL